MGRISAVLTAMHDELRRDLDACLLAEGGVDVERFDTYRHALLRHISLEEQVLMPALIAARGRPPDFRNGLRKDHAGIAALCVPMPEREWLENLKDLLDEHYRIEEEPGGFLDQCDEALAARAETVLAAIARHPTPALAPFKRGRPVRDQLRSVMLATGITGSE
ncbi:MAG: hemerythrin domain-containing protein [Myxococcaceae bacterium]|nr:hemerythrin domain-containing protein [Myxococcaceae bacterium]